MLSLRVRRCTLSLLLVAQAVIAHNGPPFPIISDRRMGPCVISLWTHPDVGLGTFFVIVDPAPGMTLPKNLKFDIGVAPLTGRLKEARYGTERDYLNGQLHFNASIPFDKEEMWRINLYLRSSAGNAEATANVMVTPPGLGRWDLLFFSLPFLGVGFLWFMGMKRRRQRRPRRPATPQPASRAT
jgi:hypothetical protein